MPARSDSREIAALQARQEEIQRQIADIGPQRVGSLSCR